MVLAKHGEVDEIYTISSGAPATPTIQGKFRFYRKDAGYNSLGMYYSVYFIRGYATHGYHDVPDLSRQPRLPAEPDPGLGPHLQLDRLGRPHLRLTDDGHSSPDERP